MTDQDAEKLVRAAAKMLMESVLSLLYHDKHYWSTRPCQTCQEITSLTGVEFGFVRYAREHRKGDST